MAYQAMYADTLVYRRQLDYTNFAESLERKPRHYVRRISFASTILEDNFGADDAVKPLSAEDQDVLSWQAWTENLQNDAEVRENLIHLSGRLCPYKNISLTLCSKVTDRDSHDQPSTEPHPLSAYRHVSFRCAMLTHHSTSDGRVQFLFSYDGLRDRDFLRWRSHDYMKLVLPKPRASYRVFTLVQWDIVDMLDPIRDGHHAPSTGPGIMKWRPCLDHVDVDHSQGDSTTEKVPNFHGVRLRRDAKRKSPYIAEVRPKGIKGSREKIWLGSYSTLTAAARAADAGHYYYNQQNRVENRFNFLDSQVYLQQIPSDLNDEGMKEFVKKEAHRLARIPPSRWVPENQAYSTSWAQGFSSPQPPQVCCGNYNCSSSRKQLPPNGNVVEASPSFVAPLMDSGRDLQKNLLSTSYRTDVLREVAGSSSDENLRLRTSNGSFTDTSQVSVGVLNPGPDQTDVCEPSLLPSVNSLLFPEENAEQDISYENAWGGLSDANDSGLHHESESPTAFQGFISSLQVAEPEWTCDDSDLIDLLLSRYTS